MTEPGGRPARKALLLDLGGVLIQDCLPAAAAAWSTGLGLTRQEFLGALFGGSDGQVLTGGVSEPAWWGIVAARLGAGPGLLAELRQDLVSREIWDEALVVLLRRLRGQAKRDSRSSRACEWRRRRTGVMMAEWSRWSIGRCFPVARRAVTRAPWSAMRGS